MICTFFGHRDAPESIRPKLHDTLIELIENQAVDTFYVGRQGRFDTMVTAELKRLSAVYPHIRYTIVLAYLPEKRAQSAVAEDTNTVYPDGLERVPRRFAIERRNRRMMDWSDIVVTYVRYTVGGAAKFQELAEKQGKRIIRL